jgi:hypothetical protein
MTTRALYAPGARLFKSALCGKIGDQSMTLNLNLGDPDEREICS